MGAHTLQSYGKGTNENQDCFIASTNGNKFLASVFDGHGEKGKVISEFAKSSLNKFLFTHKELHNDPRLALENAYRDTQKEIIDKHGPTAAESGTTAVTCYQHRDRLLVANVGDSRAVLGRCNTARKGCKAVELTSDHKPDRPDEQARVLAAGGKVDQLTFPVWGAGGGVRLMKGGPARVMDSSGFGGLAMSRSLGDLSLRPYVSSLPEVWERRLDNKDRFLIIGSDGVWDQMSNQEAVDIASRVNDPAQASREICSQARKRWNSETEGLLSDDITAVVVRLDHEQKAALEAQRTVPGTPTPMGARTSQRFFGQSGSGGATPMSMSQYGGGRDGGGPPDPRMERNLPGRLSQTIGGHGGGQRELNPWGSPGGVPMRPHSIGGNASQGSRGALGRSQSDASLGRQDRRHDHRHGGRQDPRHGDRGSRGVPRRNDLLPPAGR